MSKKLIRTVSAQEPISADNYIVTAIVDDAPTVALSLIPTPSALATESLDDDATDSMLSALAAPAPAEPVYYLTIALPAGTDAIAACVTAQMHAKKLKTGVCVHAGAIGEAFRCYDHGGKVRVAGQPSATESHKRGADWSSKSGQAIVLMMRPDGATMDEMREITGWTFGAKYVRQLERSFGVVVAVHEATARTKKTWHAEIASEVTRTSDAGHDDDEAPADPDAGLDMDAALMAMAAE